VLLAYLGHISLTFTKFPTRYHYAYDDISDAEQNDEQQAGLEPYHNDACVSNCSGGSLAGTALGTPYRVCSDLFAMGRLLGGILAQNETVTM
jgi:hypothetical protein